MNASPPVPASDWLSSGGTYYVLAFLWIVIAAGAYVMGVQIGKSRGSHNDGCLLGFVNVLLTFFGGALGLLLARYPEYIFTSVGGAILFPLIVSLWTDARLKRGR